MEPAPSQARASPQGPLEIGTKPSRNHHHATNNREFHDGGGDDNNNPAPKSLRLRGLLDTPCSVKKEKRKFWIALSCEEIKEDIFVMTSPKPARRPRKQPKNVQKQMHVRLPASIHFPHFFSPFNLFMLFIFFYWQMIFASFC